MLEVLAIQLGYLFSSVVLLCGTVGILGVLFLFIKWIYLGAK